jgi:neutral ceramidase
LQHLSNLTPCLEIPPLWLASVKVDEERLSALSSLLIHSSADVGDTSPNTYFPLVITCCQHTDLHSSLGAFCESPGKPYDGLPCQRNQSTCGGTAPDCHGRGPGFQISDFESNKIVGTKQFHGARMLMHQILAPISGGVKAVHVYMNM